jgi:hypothetical protein
MPTYSYSGDPSASDLDWVRFTIGDDSGPPWMFSDEAILATIAAQGTKEAAAVDLLRNQARRLAQRASFTIGRFSERYAESARLLNEKANELAATTQVLGLFTGGISKADRAAREADTDRVKPAFQKGMHDITGTGGFREGS